MKVSLRKANALQAAIVDMVATFELVTDISINEFENASTKINEAKNKFEFNLNNRSTLMGVQYEIRRAVSIANAQSGINNFLAEVAMIEKEIALYSKLSKVRPALEDGVISGKLEKIKHRSEDQFYGREDQVQTSIFDEFEIKEFKSRLASLKKEKTRLQDQLLELNIKTEIELSIDSVNLLAQAGII